MVAYQLHYKVNVCEQKHSVGVASYSYHLETCRELFETREGMKTEEERVPLPEDPFAGLSELPSLEKMNEMALEVYRSRSSAVCPFCDRSFRDREQLGKHNIICTKTKPLHRMGLMEKAEPREHSAAKELRRGSSSQAVLLNVSCDTCGRTFKHHYQLQKHNIGCNSAKPLKRRSF